MTAIERVFLEALEDLRAGREEPVERYLERVPTSDRGQLADLLASYFASQTRRANARASAAVYEQVLAAIDRVGESAGAAGVLPGMLGELSRTRGLKRSELLEQLGEQLDISPRARPLLRRLYHRLEAGALPGRGLSRRLLAALGQSLRIPVAELEAASEPIGRPRALHTAQAFARADQPMRLSAATPSSEEEAPTDPELLIVYNLFYGGRDA